MWLLIVMMCTLPTSSDCCVVNKNCSAQVNHRKNGGYISNANYSSINEKCTFSNAKQTANNTINHKKTPYPSSKKDYRCKWIECKEWFKNSMDLTKHVKEKHVQPVDGNEIYFCLWDGCKVYNKPSCSYKWLFKHVNIHTGHSKSFNCVIDGCELSFATRNGLARHVPSHFNYARKKPKKEFNDNSSYKDKGTLEEEETQGISPSKKELRRNKLKLFLRRRRQNAQVKKDDGFDQFTMDYIQKKVVENHGNEIGTFGFDGRNIRLNNQVLARRTTPSGETEFLVDWAPCKALNGEWLQEDPFRTTRSLNLPIHSLPIEAHSELYSQLFRYRVRHRGRRK